MTAQAAMKVANVSGLTDNLWVGGDLEVRDPELALAQLDELAEAGISDIVDLRLEWNDQDWVTKAMPHLKYRWLGVDDAGQRMPDDWFDTGTSYALAAINRGGRVLVHCHMGINRGPSMGYAVLLALGWDPIEALDRMRSQRPIAYVGYAEDALDWWLRKDGAPPAERNEWRLRLGEWRSNNHLDVAAVIRRIRLQEET